MSDPIVDALETLLTTDPQFVAELQALNLGTAGGVATPTVLRSNRRFEQIGQEHYPCFVIDAGDGAGQDGGNDGGGDAAGLSLGSCSQDWAEDFDLAFVWINQDHAASLGQRRAVFTAVVRLLLRNPDLNRAVTLAYVAQAANDSNQRHPTHFSSYVVRVHHTIHRD
ncbi:MAG: hypothetical protein ACREPV_01160 [Lysobacter sp.]